MQNTKYRIKPGNKIFSKSLGNIDNTNLTDEIAEKLLSSGGYDSIIELIPVAESESAPKKVKKVKIESTDNIDGDQITDSKAN